MTPIGIAIAQYADTVFHAIAGLGVVVGGAVIGLLALRAKFG